MKAQCQFFKRGLGHRAFEIFVNEGKSLRFYTRCPKDPGSNKRFTDKVPLCAAPDEIQASLPLWIPFFVKVNTGWSYTSICEALGTRLLSEEEDFQKFKREYLKLAACHIQEITPARLDQSREGVLPKRISTTGEDAAVETHFISYLAHGRKPAFMDRVHDKLQLAGSQKDTVPTHKRQQARSRRINDIIPWSAGETTEGART
ncbi:hypothetical protein NKR19_g9196 [Coniochaeta hoffmannii]|uniref:Uncharacterized protein n=1 Tax=Coniochaeta hoffmannii TaxID=91930 RepID=A0AA38RB95_9PEZI|nr:hypothetical protein NKR19_g9196 [Coniochaeta hoffmannii]